MIKICMLFRRVQLKYLNNSENIYLIKNKVPFNVYIRIIFYSFSFIATKLRKVIYCKNQVRYLEKQNVTFL